MPKELSMANSRWVCVETYMPPAFGKNKFRNNMVVGINHHALLSIIIGFLRETDFSFLEENKND